MSDKQQVKALLQGGQLAGAKSACLSLCRHTSTDPEAWFLLGNIHGRLGEFEEAEACFRKVLDITPDTPVTHNALGAVCQQQGRQEDAAGRYRKALELSPSYAEAHYNLASVLQTQGRLAEAVTHFGQVLELTPSCAEAHNNLAAIYLEMHEPDTAAEHCRRALSIKPPFPAAHYNLGIAFQEQGETDRAIDHYQQALDIDPSLSEVHSHLLFALNYSTSYAAPAVYEKHKEWSKRHAQPVPRCSGPRKNKPDPERRLRIGYVSGDFFSHPVAQFIEPVLAGHDRSQTEIYCYSNVAHPDEMTVRLQEHAGHWRNIHAQDDERVAARIREDGIDILVDLSGHTANNRLLVFARKPAPVQVTYLGYPNTTGMSAIDYRLTDKQADPEGPGDELYSEALVRLGGGFLCFGAPPDSPLLRALPMSGGGQVTFGCFNNSCKVTPDVIALWSSILSEVPDSRLLLKSKQLGNAAVQARYAGLFLEHGISPERVDIMGRIPDSRSHLDLYRRVDIALDPFPYNGTTTTCEALWMGVPVITLAGSRHAGRVGASILSAVGLPELIVQTPEHYREQAVSLASNPGHLQALRTGLRNKMRASALMDRQCFTHSLEGAYRRMWRTWCERNPG